MKEKELRQHAVCSKCGRKIGHTGVPLFWTVEVRRHGIKLDAVKRQSGFAMMMGSPELARVMGPDEEMTEELYSANMTLCENCGMEIMLLIESCR